MVTGWQFCLISLALASIAFCAFICYAGYRRNRREILPPPQSSVSRHTYREMAYRVGCMSGVGK